MKENTLQRIGQTKWARKLLIILMTAILMLSASAAVTLAAPPTGPGLSGVADTPLFGTITIDGIEWIKIREQAQPTATELGELYAMLMPVKVLPGNAIYYAASHSISSPVTYYKSSTLRSTINNWYAGANIPTIKAFAMRNYLNYVGHTEYLDNAGKASDTNTGIYYELAGNVTADTAFALTYTEANSIGYANFNWLEGGPRDTKSYFLRTVYTGTIWGARGWVTSPRGWGYININDNAYVRPAIWVYQGPKTPEPQILSLSTAPITTLVANHAANLPVTLTGTGLAGKQATFSLVNSAGVPVYSYGPVAISDNFHQVLNISTSALTIPYGNYTFKATLVGVTGTASVPLTIAKDLDSYWTFAIKVSPYSGQLTLSAVFDLGGYDTVQVVDAVYVNNVLTTNYIANGNTIWFPSGPTSGTVNIRFAGLKYNTLYPGFIIMLEKTVTL